MFGYFLQGALLSNRRGKPNFVEMANLGLTEICEEDVDPDVTILNLANNQISEIPDWIWSLKSLETLNISNNIITEIICPKSNRFLIIYAMYNDFNYLEVPNDTSITHTKVILSLKKKTCFIANVPRDIVFIDISPDVVFDISLKTLPCLQNTRSQKFFDRRFRFLQIMKSGKYYYFSKRSRTRVAFFLLMSKRLNLLPEMVNFILEILAIT